jgi:hypothetical protein
VADQRLGILIEAQNRAAAAVGQFIADIKRTDQALKEAKKTADGSAESNLKVGRAALEAARAKQIYREAARRLTQDNAALTASQLKFREAMQSSLTAVQQHVAAMNPAAAQVSSFTQVLTQATGAAGPFAIAMGGVALVATAAAGGILAASQAAARHQEQMNLLSERTGFATAELAGLSEAAVAQGRSFQEFQPALDFFVRKVGEAARGNDEAKRKFKELGIEVRDAAGQVRPTGEIYRDVSERLREAGSEAERSAISFDLFGRSGSKSVSIFSASLTDMVAAARQRGSILNPETEQTLTRLDDAFDSIGASINAVKLQFIALVGVRVEPFLTEIDKMIKKVQEFANSEATQRALSLARAILDPKAPGERNQVSIGRDARPGEETTRPGPPILGPPLPSEEELKAAKAITDQLDATKDLTKKLDLRRQLSAITVSDELKQLESMKAQVSSAEELLLIKQKIAALKPVDVEEFRQEILRRAESPVPINPALLQIRPIPGVLGRDAQGIADTELRPTIEPSLDITFPEMSEAARNFLDEFENFPALLEVATGSTGEVNEAVLGFVGTMNQFQLSALELGQTLAVQVRGAFRTMVSGFIDGTESVGEAFTNLVKQMIAAIAEQAIMSGFLKLASIAFAAAVPAVSPVTASGATFAQGGGVLDFRRGGAMNPYRAAAGGRIISGTVGRDSEHVLAQKNEAFLDTSLTDMLRRDLMERRSERTRPTRGGDTINHVTIPLTVHTLMADKNTLNQAIDEELLPRIKRSLDSGSYRTGG